MSYALLRQLRRTFSFTLINRMESTVTNVTPEEFIFRPSMANWSKVIKDAEKIVGYPTSFMNLRWLLSDEFANMAVYLRKIVGSNHPIVETAKNLLYNEQNNLQPWGLIILLLSNALQKSQTALQVTNITEKQRILAELTEMIRTGHYIHRGVLNTDPDKRKDMDTEMFGNKLAILIGDYLLVTANGMLARIRDQKVSYVISTALRDISEGEFYGPRDVQNMPIPTKLNRMEIEDVYNISCDTLPLDTKHTLGYPIREWTVRTLFNGGSLFGRGCQGAFLLSKESIQEQERAYLFGCNLCLAWQAASEIQKLQSDKNEPFSLVSAPVLFALQSNPDLFEIVHSIKDNVTELDYSEFKNEVLKTDAIDRTRLLYDNHIDIANSLVNMFGDNKSIDTIRQLMKTF